MQEYFFFFLSVQDSSSWHRVNPCIRDAQNPEEDLAGFGAVGDMELAQPKHSASQASMQLLIYQGAFAHPYFAQAATGTHRYCGSGFATRQTVVCHGSPSWGFIWLLQSLGSSPWRQEPEGSGESRARIPAFPLCKYLQELLPCCLLCSSSAPPGCASLAIPSGFCIWHRTLFS